MSWSSEHRVDDLHKLKTSTKDSGVIQVGNDSCDVHAGNSPRTSERSNIPSAGCEIDDILNAATSEQLPTYSSSPPLLSCGSKSGVVPRWIFDSGVDGHIRSPTDDLLLRDKECDLEAQLQSMNISTEDVGDAITCNTVPVNNKFERTANKPSHQSLKDSNRHLRTYAKIHKPQVPSAYDTIPDVESETGAVQSTTTSVCSLTPRPTTTKRKSKNVLGHCIFKPTSMWSLDSQIYKNFNTTRFRDMLLISKSQRASPKPILKPYDAASLYVYHYAPLTKTDAFANCRDPRDIIPRTTTESAIPSVTLMLAPEMFQQPWTLTQLLYAVRSPIDAPLAWLSAVLDIYTYPEAMEIDRVTRWNAYGPAAVPYFAPSSTVSDSGVELDKPGPCDAVPVSLLGIVPSASPRKVHFAPSVVTSVAFIEPANAGKLVKKRSSRKYPVVYALPGTRTFGTFDHLYTTPLVSHVALHEVSPDLLSFGSDTTKNEPNIDIRIDMAALNSSSRMRVWSIVSPVPMNQTPRNSLDENTCSTSLTLAHSLSSIPVTDDSCVDPANTSLLTKIQSIARGWLTTPDPSCLDKSVNVIPFDDQGHSDSLNASHQI